MSQNSLQDEQTIKETEVCTCECHVEGMMVMHCMPCCNYTYEKYLNEDGTLNPVKWGQTLRRSYEQN